MKRFRKIKLPLDIIQAVENHLGALGVDNVEEYVEAVLRERLVEAGLLSPYNPDEEREVEQRLRDLGYLD